MNRKTTFLHLLLVLAVFSLLAGSSAPAVMAQNPPTQAPEEPGENPFRALPAAQDAPTLALADPTPGLFYQSYSGIMFYPVSSAINAAYSYTNGTRHTVAPTTGGTFVMPLNLPQGVEIREITIWFRDNQPSADVTIGLCIVPNGETASGCMADEDQVDTTNTGDTGAILSRTLTGTPIEVIDNYNNSYFLGLTLTQQSSQFGLISAQVGYASSSFMPTVTR